MNIIISFLFGLLIGSIVRLIFNDAKSIGKLQIEASDQEDKPYIFLSLFKDIEHLTNKKYVILKVNTKKLISHK